MKPYYEQDGITIYHGDCREVLPGLDSVDLVITDPPYSEHTHAKQWIGNALTAEGKPRVATNHSGLGFAHLDPEFQVFLAGEFARLSRRWVLSFCDLEGVFGWRLALMDAGLEYVRTAIWDKVDSAPQFTGDRPASAAEAIVCAHPTGKKKWNGGGRRNVFRYAVNGERGPKPHPTTKPLPLMRDVVSLFADAGELILDPFAGSGTTLVAAHECGCCAIGIEIEERYCEIAAKRLAQGVLFGNQQPQEAGK